MSFLSCDSLTRVTVAAPKPPALGKDVFKYYDNGDYPILENLNAIYVPAGSVAAYTRAEGWKEYASYIRGL